MKSVFIEGFKDSIRLAVSIVVGVVLALIGVGSSFANHTMNKQQEKPHLNAGHQ